MIITWSNPDCKLIKSLASETSGEGSSEFMHSEWWRRLFTLPSCQSNTIAQRSVGGSQCSGTAFDTGGFWWQKQKMAEKKKEAMPDEAEYEEDYVFGYFLNH